MTDEQPTPQSASEIDEQIRQIDHDIKSTLSVITIGLQALEGACGEPAEFSELRTLIEDQGVEPLKKLIAKLVELAGGEAQ